MNIRFMKKIVMMRAILGLLLLACVNPLASADAVDILLMPGNLIQGHVKWEEGCDNCHKKYDKEGQSILCKECHKDIAKDISNRHGYHGLLKEEKHCKECHTDHKGRDARIIKFETLGFDHLKQTGFELKGGHLDGKVLCKDCHSPLKKYREAPTKCNACHERDDKHKGSLGPDCQNCHEEKNWKTTHFDHSKTHFPLLGKHFDVKCKNCHINNKYKDTPKLCNECHKKDDKHNGNFGEKCETCHTEKDWNDIKFDHDKSTKYPLLGKHIDATCKSCHKGSLYKDKLKTDCYSCHRKDDKHKGNFGVKCESCHTERDWKEILFDHNKKTKFPLHGKHRDVKCSGCHKGDLYKDKLKMDCYSCHKKDDKHKGGFGVKCESCHTVKGWKDILFDHDKTKFPLLGKHRDTKCSACHKGDAYKEKLKMDCYSCHLKDDKHKGQEGKKCEVCHDEKSWTKAKFDHRQSRFALTGKHQIVDCKKCHLTPLFKDVKSDCWSCHAKKDVHGLRFGTNCKLCHNNRDWMSWDFDHNKTGFKLQGKHKSIRCSDCHNTPVKNNKFVIASSCILCHDKDDKHDGAFGIKCENCHNGSSWKTVKVGSKRWELR
jgi:hypothetical protein